MQRTALAFAAALLLLQSTEPAQAAARPAAKQAQASPAGTQVWDLSQLYASDAAWDAERLALLAELPKVKALQGTLGQSAQSLRAGLDQISALRLRLNRLQSYAFQKADENTQNSEAQARRQLADAVGNQFGEAASFVSAEVGALGAPKVEGFLAAEAGLAKHGQGLRTMLRLAEHTLSPKEEALLAGAADPLQQPGAIYGLLTNADLPWPKIKIRGKEVVLDQEQYTAYRSDADPKVREQVFKAFWPVYKAYERTLGAVYAANLRGTVFMARARKYPSSVAMAQGSDNIPEAVYRSLVQEANAGLPTLHRYLKLRSQVLGLKKAGYQDMYVPLAKPSGEYSQAEAERLTLAALQPLGAEYTGKLAAAFKQNWMHSVPQRGKVSGAYMNGAAYDVHPFLLMSYNGDYLGMSTLAHEWGHAMHSVYSNANQPFETADYSTFIAEIPSTANELLLADYMIANAKTREEKIFALSQQLENIRSTFFRQAMFAEFELASHEAVEKGEAVTGESLSQIYLDLLKRYHGDAQNVVKIDPLYGIEWAYIPHFYRDFYVYQYATCVSAAAFFAEGIGQGDTALRERYFTLLKSGSSADAYALTRAAGLDLATPEPYRALLRRMNRAIDQLETLLAKK
ncbi:oligoendopeptidase F [Paucibacter sp. DJ2R-2]|uniref:oligoendopeptidase F n=1 Tax=Paucibacter sp. DJ2R-2 TaxID=2893558 RepID=UPI0021E4A122|nr:oligoendopeptidase F [Paucibacter sp. DJ2R-2]MCV2419616.1 oligoendopeptidase F [Paucibacter sp. DJ4R-1]MCV2437480.1 oligoendopeptidase F [Paucibacter sp. DJ2R-2]